MSSLMVQCALSVQSTRFACVNKILSIMECLDLSIPGATFLNTIKTGIQIYYDIKLVSHNLICLVIHFLKINQPNMTASFGNLILDKSFCIQQRHLKFGFQNLVKLSWKICKLQTSVLIRQFFLQLNFPSIEFRIFPGSNIFIFAKCHIFS